MCAKFFAMVTTKVSSRYTDFALRSFFEHTVLRPTDHFLLIDNDGDYDASEFAPKVELVRNKTALSFAANANHAIDCALAENAHLYFMNNDIILTPDWLSPLLSEERSILTPLSNREVQYRTEAFTALMVMSLEDYLPQARALPVLAKVHRECTSGYKQVTALPFFCVKIPLEIMNAVGHFDESFGKAGGEDYDYCLRAYLAGFAVKYALPSFVLHFGGKSSWSGVESRATQGQREVDFRAAFGYKWGLKLMKFLLFEDREIVKEGSELHAEILKGNHKYVIEVLKGDKEYSVYL